ncbi:carboxypeptidase-like regulatory domain-containing protein [Bacteroides sp.]|uniref:carboxypeptidase-like regulatory domain-containing protein n=1 Tax=Bacteroides sp. TaxID=29523 RepID=UPI003AB187D1
MNITKVKKAAYKLQRSIPGRAGICLLMTGFCLSISAQHLTQNIRGTVTDKASGIPIAYATIQLEDAPDRGAITDSIGNFVLKGISLGRHNVKATFIGYEPSLIREVLVSSAKEVFLEIAMTENAQELNEVVVRPQVNKEQALNKMALTGARMFSVEEASRYAGGMDDPARLASSFAGISSGVSHNGISIHGNAPHLLQWRLEDIEIPNPNHYADIATLGGGILSSLSNHVLGNSDFFTGAFPAEYGNAVSGVFDMKLRNGNNRKVENTIQAGILGIDVASEGPLSKKHNSSYIVNYRYSATGLLAHLNMVDLGGAFDYQDLNFKFNFPTRRLGTFSIWGTSLIDKYGSDLEKDISKWEYLGDGSDSKTDQYMAAGGISHRYFIGENGLLKTTIATTYFKSTASIDMFDTDLNSTPYLDMSRENTNLVFTTSYNHKFSARFTNKTGASFTQMFYDMKMNLAPFVATPLDVISMGDGSTSLFSAYTSNSIDIGNNFTLNLGLNTQVLTLNKHWTLEPRIGMKWQATAKTSFALAYGLHSRMEKMDVYYTQTPQTGDKLVNKDLDFTKANHFMLTFDYKISDDMLLKIEPYFQTLFDVPVRADDSYSVLNREDFYVEDALVNKGKGRNIGVDVTLEKYLSRGYYYMFTGSLFDSRYCGGDKVWHNTKFNRHYILNLLGGKEWMMGHNKQNILSVNAKLTLQGGDRYSPIDEAATMEHPDKEVQYDETKAYSRQFSPIFLTNFSVSYKINKKKCTHEFAVKLLNATNYKEYGGHEYNIKTGKIEVNRFAMSLPNIYYKVEF